MKVTEKVGIPVSAPFQRLDEAKQRAILDAAMAEFSEHGYDNASTNRIVARAGISKGLLFHYFGNKEGLFLYLIDYTIDLSNRMLTEIDTDVTDPIERWGQAARLKHAYARERPHIFDFFSRAYIQEQDRLPPEAVRRIEEAIHAAKARLYTGIDMTLFRPDVDPTHAFRIIEWSIEGYRQQLLEEFRHKSVSIEDRYWDEFYTLLRVLKKILYRQEDAADERRANAGRHKDIR